MNFNCNVNIVDAIMGAGNIANKFCDAVKRMEDCEVAAVASKSMDRAENFAEKNGIKAAYDSYEKMLAEEKPDCVYIAVTQDAHFALCMLCLDYKTPVLCEKAMFLNSAQAEEVFTRAEKEKVFVMEAMWSRFLPAVKMAKQWMEEGKIGTPSFIDTAIGFLAPVDKDNRYYSPKLGGGAAYDITVYAYELTTFMIERPAEDVQVSAVWSDTGVDISDQVTIRYPGLLASLRTSFAKVIHEVSARTTAIEVGVGFPQTACRNSTRISDGRLIRSSQKRIRSASSAPGASPLIAP